jgi:hypothetical protein
MLDEQITEWLQSDNPDWSRGLSLFVSASQNRHLVRLLTKRGRTPKTMRLLTYELSRITKVKPSVHIEVTRQASNPAKRIRSVNPPLKIHNKKLAKDALGEQVGDPYLISLITREKEAFKEYAYIRDIILYQTISVRCDQAARIVQLRKITKDLWHQIDYYKIYHVPFPVASQEDLVDTNKKIGNLKTYVSRYKGYAADVTRNAEYRAKYQRMHDEYLLELQSLEAKIRT